MTSYAEFIEQKGHTASHGGFAPRWMPQSLFPFQRHLVEWSQDLGRAAIFADCGLGKTPMQLTWAQNIVEHTNRRVLILTPLAVSRQTLREAQKFGIPAVLWADPKSGADVRVANYEQLHHLDASDYAAVVCDESSILKNFDGVRRKAVTEFLRQMPYRLLCTATAAPNDYVELGTSSEALGGLGYMDMLNRFFVNDQHSSHPNRLIAGAAWRFRGHAAIPFWQWTATWARACRQPSDLGFDNGGFALPPLDEREHVVIARTALPGQLFARAARDMREERIERRRTVNERCEMAAELVAHDRPAVVWCHLNDEGAILKRLIPGSVEVSGADSDEAKETAFAKFADGSIRVLITKPKIGAWGLNWQHCAHVVTFASHSYEQYYQSVRRCWRFGQTSPVVVDIIASEGEMRVKENLQRKAANAVAMFEELVACMRSAQAVSRLEGRECVEVPSWL